MEFMTIKEINIKLIYLVKNERKLTQEILTHINLFEKCAGHLKLGYSSMHQYLTRELGYSDDQAFRRLKAARLLNQVPEVADKLQDGSLNLSQAAQAQKAFETAERETGKPVTVEVKKEIIDSLENATNFETKSLLNNQLNLRPEVEEKIKPQSNKTIRLEITLTQTQFDKLQTIKSLLSQKNPGQQTGDILEAVFDFFIAKKQVNKKEDGFDIATSNSKKRASQTVNTEKTDSGKRDSEIVNSEETISKKIDLVNADSENIFSKKIDASTVNALANDSDKSNSINMIQSASLIVELMEENAILKNSPQSLMKTKRQCDKPSRYVPISIKKSLYARSGGRCEFINENGIRCNSQYQVQMDHINPYSLGGKNTLDNLRNCCRSHNSYLATLAGIGIETTLSCKN